MNIKINCSSLADLEKEFGPLTIGLCIRTFRLADGISQTAYAKRLGLTRAKLCDIEKGRRLIPLAKASFIAKKLGLPPELLIKIAIEDSLRNAHLKYHIELKAA